MEMSWQERLNDLSCWDKFYQTFLDESNNDINVCVRLRECKESLTLLALQSE